MKHLTNFFALASVLASSQAFAFSSPHDLKLENALVDHLQELKDSGVIKQFMITNGGDEDSVVALVRKHGASCFTESAFYSENTNGIIFRDLDMDADCSPFNQILPH
jgi:hypothetical protein